MWQCAKCGAATEDDGWQKCWKCGTARSGKAGADGPFLRCPQCGEPMLTGECYVGQEIGGWMVDGRIWPHVFFQVLGEERFSVFSHKHGRKAGHYCKRCDLVIIRPSVDVGYEEFRGGGTGLDGTGVPG